MSCVTGTETAVCLSARCAESRRPTLRIADGHEQASGMSKNAYFLNDTLSLTPSNHRSLHRLRNRRVPGVRCAGRHARRPISLLISCINARGTRRCCGGKGGLSLLEFGCRHRRGMSPPKEFFFLIKIEEIKNAARRSLKSSEKEFQRLQKVEN